MDAATPPSPAHQMRQLRRDGRADEAEAMAADLLSGHPRLSVIKEAAYLAFFREDWPETARRYQWVFDQAPSDFDEKYFIRLYDAYVATGQSERGLACLMEGVYRYPKSLALTERAAGRIVEIGQSVERWRPAFGRDGPNMMASQAEMFRRVFLGGDALAAHWIKDTCAEIYGQWPTEGLSNDVKYQRAAALVHMGDHERAKEWMAHQGWGKWKEGLVLATQLTAYCDLALGADPKTVFEGLFQAEHRKAPSRAAPGEPWTIWDHADYFRGKTIAIVGPASTGQDLAAEIDSFDIVVRTNVFSMEAVMATADRLGRRADVSYYTNATFLGRPQDLYDVANETGLIPVMRRRANVVAARLDAGLLKARVSGPSPRNFLPSFGSMHALQRMMWDLLKFSPARLKIFNANFYAGGMYESAYTPKKKAPSSISLGVPHDPLKSFLFTKTLLASGAIECDPVATEVLKWSRDQYIDMMQRDFADHWKGLK